VWRLHDIQDRVSDVYFTDSHIELRCVFQQSGSIVYVTSPTVSFSPSAPKHILQPFMLDQDDPPQYSIKFLTTDMQAQKYEVTFSGLYQGSTMIVTGEFELYEVTREQALINTLRSLLKDVLPKLYVIKMPDADTFRWTDGELYTCITQALNAMNEAPPSTIRFTLQNIPFENFLLQISMIFALNMRGMLEIANVLNYSDEIAFNLDRDAKYASKAQLLASVWWEGWKAAKKDYTFHSIQHQAIISTRFPLHFVRPLSMLPNSKNTFGWW